jgi:hypothetical protein
VTPNRIDEHRRRELVDATVELSAATSICPIFKPSLPPGSGRRQIAEALASVDVRGRDPGVARGVGRADRDP